jgi:cytosine/adenosine deaminase-related metal-dependent hydrolase
MLITHGQVFTLGQRNELIPDGAIAIEGDAIAEVGTTAALEARYPRAQRLDADGKLVLPGSICGHTHFYGAFARGMAIPGQPAADFVQILERLAQGSDHPVLLTFPESAYLKGLVCRVW